MTEIPTIDEISNIGLDELDELFTPDVLRAELDRISNVIETHSSTGTDLSYWFRRERIINRQLEQHAFNAHRESHSH